MKIAAVIPLLLTTVAVGGCVGGNEVLFVTNTNAGINLDSTPPNASIGYDRQEGYIGPAYENGALPPVVAQLSSNLNLLNPEIRQTYATGAAAKQLAEPNRPLGPDLPLTSRSREVAYFVTESSTGLRVTFTNSPVPQSLHFGYRRKEFSLLPIGTIASGSCSGDDPKIVPPATTTTGPVDCYPSVLAKINVGANVKTPTDTGMGISQFFATGRAANTLATNRQIANIFDPNFDVTPLLQGNAPGNCDAACKLVGTFLRKDPVNNLAALRKLCPSTAAEKELVTFQFSPQRAADRAGCAAKLPT